MLTLKSHISKDHPHISRIKEMVGDKVIKEVKNSKVQLTNPPNKFLTYPVIKKKKTFEKKKLGCVAQL